ncbi:MAG: hypothetical protein ACUVTP_07440 [Candidatus Fervidibacter sp.]|uniref:hypothetical protein n=1 Tax=Candidatus Fervidibacter sp. TaxID=3100871 RepID=UPI00404A5485
MRCFIVSAVMLLTSVVSAQQPNLIRGRVLKPDGTPARNCQGLMRLRTHELDEKGGLDKETAFPFQTDQEGFLHSLKPVFRNADLVGEETLRAMEKDIWRSGEPLPTLQLKPWISRPDDPSAEWNAKDLEWLPADEWLSVNNFSVRLSPLEERKLLLPVMPASEIPVHIQVRAHPLPPTEKLHPPLEFGFQLLPWSGRDWEGIVKVD